MRHDFVVVGFGQLPAPGLPLPVSTHISPRQLLVLPRGQTRRIRRARAGVDGSVQRALGARLTCAFL